MVALKTTVEEMEEFCEASTLNTAAKIDLIKNKLEKLSIKTQECCKNVKQETIDYCDAKLMYVNETIDGIQKNLANDMETLQKTMKAEMDKKLEGFQPNESELNELKKQMLQIVLNSTQIVQLMSENSNMKQKIEKLEREKEEVDKKIMDFNKQTEELTKRLETLEEFVSKPA